MLITLETYSFKFTPQEQAQGMPESWNMLTEIVDKVMERGLSVKDPHYREKIKEGQAKHKAVFDKKVRSKAVDGVVVGAAAKKAKKYALVGGALIGLGLAAYKIAQKVQGKKAEKIKKKIERLRELETKQKESTLTKAEIMELVSISRYLVKAGVTVDRNAMNAVVSGSVNQIR